MEKRMKKFVLVMSVLAFVLAACGTSNTEQVVPTVVLEDGSAASSEPQSSSGDTVAASAVVVPLNEAALSFTSIGRVTVVNVKVGDKVNAGDVLVQLDTSILEARVREAEANLAAAEIQVKYLIRVGTTEQHLEVAQNDVARAQALVDSAKAVLAAQSDLTAPFAATVISVNISPYETVAPGQVVVILGDLTRYRIETTDLSERDVTKVKEGQSVDVFIEALNDSFAGNVVDVDRISSEIGGDVVYKVTVELDEQPADVRWGMSADVEISVGE
jgi:RND family efflux transporter MFP subunit